MHAFPLSSFHLMLKEEKPQQIFFHMSSIYLASFPGSSAPEQEIELVHAERTWYFLLT